MPQFSYRARNAQGGLVEGVLNVADRSVAIREIEQQIAITRVEGLLVQQPEREVGGLVEELLQVVTSQDPKRAAARLAIIERAALKLAECRGRRGVASADGR